MTCALPGAALDGKIDTTALNAFFTTPAHRRAGPDRPLPALRPRQQDAARTASSDGYVRFDAVLGGHAAHHVPYSYTNDILDAALHYAMGKVDLEGGWKYNRMERTFRETSEWRQDASGHFTPTAGSTTENVFRVAADFRGDWFMLRGMAEVGSRDFDSYDAADEEHALPGARAVPPTRPCCAATTRPSAT